MDSAAFLARYPEFSSAAEALVTATLAEANTVVRTDDVPTAVADAAIGAYAAMILADTPGGRALRVAAATSGDKSSAQSPYERAWLRWRTILGVDGVAL